MSCRLPTSESLNLASGSDSRSAILARGSQIRSNRSMVALFSADLISVSRSALIFLSSASSPRVTRKSSESGIGDAVTLSSN